MELILAGFQSVPAGFQPPEPGMLMITSMAWVPSWQDKQASEIEPTGASLPSRLDVLSAE